MTTAAVSSACCAGVSTSACSRRYLQACSSWIIESSACTLGIAISSSNSMVALPRKLMSSLALTASTRSCARCCGGTNPSVTRACTSWEAISSLTGQLPVEGVVAHNRTTQASYTPDPPRRTQRVRMVGARGVRSRCRVHRGPARVFAASGRRLLANVAVVDRSDTPRPSATLGDSRPSTTQAMVEGTRDARRRCCTPDLALRRVRSGHVHRGRLLPRPRACRVQHARRCIGAACIAGVRGSAQAAHGARQSAGVLHR